MNNFPVKSVKASTAITTVLILGSIATIVTSLMLFQSTDNAIVPKVLREGKKAEYAALACGEIALEKLRESSSYAGNESITISGSQTCAIGAITSNAGAYTILTSAISGEATKSLTISVSGIDTAVEVVDWSQ